MEPVDEDNNYSIVLTNIDNIFNPGTFQNRVYELNANGTFKKIRTGQCCGVYATQAMYASAQGIKHRPTLSWSTPNNIYSSMSVVQRSPLNALKGFLNDHPCVVSWHNGKTDDLCRINGFHMHIVVQKGSVLWHDNAWRAIRQKLQNAGITVRCQKVKSLSSVLYHLQEKPRFLAGCNNAGLCKILITGAQQSITDQEMSSLFSEDNDMVDGQAEMGQVDFFQAMTGWTNTSAVGSTSPGTSGSQEFNISNFLMGGPSEIAPKFQTNSPFGQIVSDKESNEAVCPSTRTSKKVVVCQGLIAKYGTHDPTGLLDAIMEGEDSDDLETFRVLKCTPQFHIIWDQAVMEIQAIQRKAGVTYVDQLFNATIPGDLNTMPVEDTASFWLQWCEYQALDPAMVLIEMYAVLSMAYPKRNCFALIGASDAGKTYWMSAVACLTAQRGDTITSGDFMWQECIDKALIYIPELSLTKPDQVESFKKVCEGQTTNINVKNKRAAVLNRTPVILTSNTPPWSFFTNEEAPIRNRMFLHNVGPYRDWQPNQGSANTLFFVEIFKLIRTCVANDNAWPYDLESEDVQVLLDFVHAKMNKLTKECRKQFNVRPDHYDTASAVDMDVKWALASITNDTLAIMKRQSSGDLCASIRELITANCETPYFKLLPKNDGVDVVDGSWLDMMGVDHDKYKAKVTRATRVLSDVSELIYRFPNVCTGQKQLDAQFYVKRFIKDMLEKLETFVSKHFSASRLGKRKAKTAPAPVRTTRTKKHKVGRKLEYPISECYECENEMGSQVDHSGVGGCMGPSQTYDNDDDDTDLNLVLDSDDDEADCQTVSNQP